MRLAFPRSYDGKEYYIAIKYKYFFNKDIEIRCFDNPMCIVSSFVPIGTVEFLEGFFGQKIKPNYFPTFLNNYIGRKVWLANSIEEINQYPVAIKPADEYKRFNLKIANHKEEINEKPPFICSEIVTFLNEWRYYIANGEVVLAEWYKGEEIMPTAPLIKVDYPPDYCGAVDFGETVDGRILLIEAHHPFACGFYGESDKETIEKYFEWCELGVKFMLTNLNKCLT